MHSSAALLEAVSALRDSTAQRALLHALAQPPARAVALLGPLLFADDIAGPAADAFAQAAGALRALQWTKVERQRAPAYVDAATAECMAPWFTATPDSARALGDTPRDVLHACALSRHPRGYVREAAVVRMGLSQDSAVLPWLLLRLNDWAIPVRTAAGRALAAWLAPQHHASWARLLPLVQTLALARRSGHAAFIARVEQLLLEQPAGLLVDARNDVTASRSAARLLLTTPDAVVWAHAAALATHRDPVVRRALLLRMRGASAAAFEELRVQLGRDKDPRVRDLMLDILVERGAPEAPVALLHGTRDPSARVRSTARFYAQKIGPRDFRAEALARLAPFGVSATAADVLPLCDLATAADAPVFAMLLGAKSRRVRCLALEVWGRIAPRDASDVLWPLVFDADDGLARRACAALRRLDAVDVPHLERLLGSPHWRRALRLIGALPARRVGTAWLRVGANDPALAAHVEERLAHWCARVGMIGMRAQRVEVDACRAALLAATFLRPGTVARVEVVLRDEERLIARAAHGA